MNEPTHLDLFSGIGGFALAAQWAGFRTIGFCEIDKYCQKVLAKNFNVSVAYSKRSHHTQTYEAESGGNGSNDGIFVRSGVAGIFPEITEIDGRWWRGVDLITGGFPCQPFSVAGKRRGAADYRAIWPEMFRVISEARPAWVLGENVPGIIPMELDNVLSDLEGIGYATRTFVIPACAVDARHRRDRLWIVCTDANGERFAQRTQRNGGPVKSEKQSPFRDDPMRLGPGPTWLPEPCVGRVAHGVRNRVDRLKGLGNAIVPQVAYEILREIRKLI